MLVEIFLLSLLLLIIWNITKKPSNYPPGIWGFPIFGYIPLGTRNFDKKLEELKKKHGKVFCWKIGSKLLIFLNDHKLIKESFQTVEYANRPPLDFLNFMPEEYGLGITLSNGTHWHNTRRFMLRHLKDFGMGKSKLVSAVQYEASELVESIKKDSGKAKPLPEELKISVINILMQMVAGKRYNFNDETILEFNSLLTSLVGITAKFVLLDFFPWLKTILPSSILDLLTGRNILNKTTDLMNRTFQEYVDENKKSLDEINPRDFIDTYLIEMEKQKSNPDCTMTNRDLIGSIADLFGAGFFTTATTIYFCIFYMTKFPEVQKKLQKEVDEVLGKGSQASLEDKSKMPYTEAFINETLRYSSLTQFHLPRTVVKPTILEGYTIPPNSVILPLAEVSHYNSEFFDNPKEFQPEKFLSTGKCEIPKDGFFPFGTGKRLCIGESLARMELLIFLTTLVQNFEFSVPKGESLDITPEDLPFFNRPKLNQNIIISVRS